MPSIEQDIRRFVIENYLFGQDADELGNDDSLLDAGLVDSTGILELIAFLEREYDISIQDEELIPDNLDSVDKLVAFVERKRHPGR